MLDQIFSNIIMGLCTILHRKSEGNILTIKGKGDNYPRYLIYTENEEMYKRMDRF